MFYYQWVRIEVDLVACPGPDTGPAPFNLSGVFESESAIIITRPPANTNAIVSGKNNTTGNARVEVYTLPPWHTGIERRGRASARPRRTEASLHLLGSY
jgi:hypothetical protein